MGQPKFLTADAVIFSLKTFGAAMLAYWIALRFSLDNPYWAAGTVFIVANPLSGSITSRAIYRLLGTVLGAVATVILVPNLVGTPYLLSLAIALWCGFCLFISILDRTPRSYVFMLAGYTAALTGFTLVGTPQNSFHVALARVEEITVGILCASLVARVVFPRHAGPILAQRVKGWLKNAGSLTQDVLNGQGESAAVQKERHRLAADAVDMRAFGTFSGFEGAHGRALRDRMQALQRHMVLILPLLSEIGDLLVQLRRQDAAFDQHYPVVQAISDWLDHPDEAALSQADSMLSALAAERQTLESQADSWRLLVRLRLTKRLEDLVAVWRDCRVLAQDIERGESHPLIRKLASEASPSTALHTDYTMALYCAFAAVVATMVGCVFWIETGWEYGWNVAQLTTVFSTLMATLDDARPVLRKVFQLVLVAAGAVFVYQFAIMPSLTGFWPLVGALGLYLIPCGVLMAHPTSWFMGFQLSVNLVYMLTLHDRISSSMTGYMGGTLATVLAVIFSMGTLAVVRALGAEFSAQRLLRAAWRTVRETASGVRRPDNETVVHRMLDRMGLLVPRLAALPAGSSVLGSDILRDLRVSLDVLKIQRGKSSLPAALQAEVEGLLQALDAHYRARQQGATALSAVSLIPAIDGCLGLLLPQSGLIERRIKDALVGLRGTLCPQAEGPQLALADTRMVP